MAINKTDQEKREKRGMNFIEQIIENDLKSGKMVDAYKHVFRQSRTDICI